MSDINKSIVLGILTVSFWLVASIFLKEDKETDPEVGKMTMEYVKY